jgi:GLPGLI family protein
MKKVSVTLLAFACLVAVSAQEIVNEAVLQMKIETTEGDNSSGAPPPPPGGEGQMMIRIGEGEMKSKLFLKNGMSRVETDLGTGISTVLYDSKTKITTTLFEIMGRKMGFYTSDEELEKMMTRRDSGRQQVQVYKPEVFIEYLSDTKTIAGMVCKKANIRYKNRKGEEVEQPVWYNPDFKLGEGFRLRDIMRVANIPGMDKLKGFPMEFQTIRQNGSKVQFTITKVDLQAKVDDKLFIVPKDYDVKPMSEMGGGRNGEFQIRVNG